MIKLTVNSFKDFKAKQGNKKRQSKKETAWFKSPYRLKKVQLLKPRTSKASIVQFLHDSGNLVKIKLCKESLCMTSDFHWQFINLLLQSTIYKALNHFSLIVKSSSNLFQEPTSNRSLWWGFKLTTDWWEVRHVPYCTKLPFRQGLL